MKIPRATVAALAATLAVCAARPAPPDHVLHEERPVVEESSWVKASRIEDGLHVPVRIGYASVRWSGYVLYFLSTDCCIQPDPKQSRQGWRDAYGNVRL